MKMSRVLIVDDKEENLYLLRALLQGHGYEVVTAPHGVAALETARQDPPDLIITDILMPVMDGFALCREWKKDERLKRIPFVFYTATYTDERDREFALSLGAEGFIVKPEEPDAFMAIIRETIQQVGSAPATRAEPAAGAPPRFPTETPEKEESVYLKQYNEALIRKLEAKMEQLEQANCELEQDVAARQMAEAALRESEARFRSLVEAAPEGIFVQSQGRFVYVNPAMLRLFGASRVEDLLGMEIMERIAPECREAVRERIQLQRETGKPAPLMDQEYLRLDGSQVPVETTAVPVRYQGRDAHLVFVRDITERKQTEREKAKLEAQLAQAQKMESVGRLAGGVAHDFNNLLTVINLYSDMALRSLEPDNPLRQDLEEIRRAGDRAAQLTRQLLIFSRRQPLEMRTLNLNEVLQGLAKMLPRLLGEDILLQMKLAPDLGYIHADPGQIEQVVVNLAVNARDAMSEGGQLTLETVNTTLDKLFLRLHSGVEEGEYIMLAVSDTGVGMTEEVKAHLFEPFFTTKGPGKGTGLGLATVYGIVKQHRGHIWVYSEPGLGSTFKVYLPRVEAGPAATSRSEEATALPRGSETVLVVEDEPAVRSVAVRVLSGLGYQVLEASSGLDALQVAATWGQMIHLLLTDVIMPEMNGKALAEQLTALYPALKVLFISGYTDETISRRGVLEEGVAFLQKPFTPSRLAHKVREVLDQR